MNRLTEDLLALASVESGDYNLRLQKDTRPRGWSKKRWARSRDWCWIRRRRSRAVT